MRSDKIKRMYDAYDGFDGHQTIKHVQSQIPSELFDRLTGHELGLVMSAVNNAYHNGRNSLQGIDVCDDCVWLPWGEGQLIPIDALRNINIDDNKYTLDYTGL
jgi:hypothetical protein